MNERILEGDLGSADPDDVARRARLLVIQAAATCGGHIGGPFSAAELLAVLYFRVMKIRPRQPAWEGRDRFVLSKGHSSLALYAMMALRGYFDPAELGTFGRVDSRLQGHPDMTKLPGIDMSSGSLGLGFTGAVGIAMGARLRGSSVRVYALLGDGECQEGSIWEAVHTASRYSLSNLCAIVDLNSLQQYGWSEPGGSRRPPWKESQLVGAFRAFGWATTAVDGHDVVKLERAFEWARSVKDQPCVVVARTTKGKGVSFMEGDYTWHSRVPTESELSAALSELKQGSDDHG